MVAISKSFGAISASQIDQLETKIGRKLPLSYRSFLLRNNGGEPDLDHYPITGMADNPFGEIRMFLGLGAPNEYDDVAATLDLLQDRLPQDLLPIGYSSGGDMLCISLGPRDHGTIYFWDSQSESEPAPWMKSGYANTYFVAENLDEFLANLNSFEAFESS